MGEEAFWLGVDFVDRLHGWVVGSVEDDALLHTDDGGATWVRQRHADLRVGLGLAQAQRLSTLLRDVAFTSQTRGFAVGGDGCRSSARTGSSAPPLTGEGSGAV